jgi:hypothetical protein
MVSAISQKFIVIEGPIGVGKTSLARRLSQSLSGQLVLEQADQNPFLERFYKNPRAAAFQTQLFFLFQRARQLEEVRQEDMFGAVRVADYLLDKDRLFARVTLDCRRRSMCWWTASQSAEFVTSNTSSAAIWRSSRKPMRDSSTVTMPRRCSS